MKSIVISIGGSVVLSEEIKTDYFKKLKNLIEKFKDEYKIYLVVGGGKTARFYIKIGREIGFKENVLDQFGIDITRVNAKMLLEILDLSQKDIPSSTDDATKIKNPVVVMGGTTPGHSTDMVGAELAEKTESCKFIIATNVDGIYDKDPNKYSDANQIKEININDLIKKYGTDWESAGKNIVIDGPALKIIDRGKIPTYILNGKKLDQLEKVLNNQDFNGTTITL